MLYAHEVAQVRIIHLMFDWLCYTLTKWLKWELYNLHVWLIMLYAHEVAQVRIIQLACLIDYVIRSRSGSSENYTTCMFDWLCYTLTKWLKWELYNLHVWLIMLYAHEVAQVRIIQLACLIDYVIRSRSGSSENYTTCMFDWLCYTLTKWLMRIILLACLIDYVIRSRSGSSENYTTYMFDWLCYTLTKWLKWELYNLHVWLIMLYAHEVAQVRIIQLACLIDYVIRSRSGSSENYTTCMFDWLCYTLTKWLMRIIQLACLIDYVIRAHEVAQVRIIQLACLIDYVIRSRSGSSENYTTYMFDWLCYTSSRSGSSENYTTCMFDWLCYTLTKWLKWELYNLHVWLIMLYAHEVAQVRIIQLMFDWLCYTLTKWLKWELYTCMFDWLCYTLTKWLKWELYNLYVWLICYTLKWLMFDWLCYTLTKWLKWELYNLHVWLIMLYAHEVAQVRIIQLACLIDYVIRSRSGSSENYINLHVWLIMLYAHEVAQVRIIQLACLIDYVIRSRSGSSENYTTCMFDWLCYTLTKWLKWELYNLHVWLIMLYAHEVAQVRIIQLVVWLIMLYAHEVAQVRIIQLACLIDYVIRSRSGSSENYTTCMFDWLCYTLTKWLKWELYNLHVWLIMLYAHEVAQVRIIQLACLIDYVIRSRSGSSENYTTCMFDWLCYTLTKWLKWELYNLHVWLIMLYAHEVAQVRIIQLACLIDYVIRSRSGSSENYTTCMFDWLCYTLTKWLKWELYNLHVWLIMLYAHEVAQVRIIQLVVWLIMLYAHEVAQVRIIQTYMFDWLCYTLTKWLKWELYKLACLIDYVIRSRSGSSENYTTCMFDWLCYTLTKWLKWELYNLHVWLIMLYAHEVAQVRIIQLACLIDYVIRSRSGSSENYTTCMFDWLCYTLTKWLKWELYNLYVWLIMLYAHEVAQVRIIQLTCLIDYVIRSRSGSSENYTTCMFDWLCYTLTKWLKWELYNLHWLCYTLTKWLMHVWLIMLYAHEVAQVRIIQLACLIDYVIRSRSGSSENYTTCCLIDYVIRSRSGSSENYTTCMFDWLCYTLTKWLKWELYNLYVWLIMLYAHEVAQV